MKNGAALSIVGLSLALVACSTPSSKTESFAGNTTAPASKAYSDADRRIAQQATTEYTIARQSFPPVCGQPPKANLTVKPTQVLLTSREDLVVRYTVNTPIYACEDTEGDGRGGDWKGFYDTAGNKANMLDKAIMGVGEATSKPLVEKFAAGKPRSWRAFSNIIISAANEFESKYGISKGWKDEVLYRYKKENMENLGYAAVGVACEVARVESNTYELRTKVKDIPMVVELSIEGGKLLADECETFAVSFDGRDASAGVASERSTAGSEYNTYSMSKNYDTLTSDFNTSGRKIQVKLTGKRIQKDPTYFVEHSGSTISSSGGAVQLNLRNARYQAAQATQEFAEKCKLSATALFFGQKGNSLNGKKSKEKKAVTVALDAKASSTNISGSITLGEKERAAATVTTAFAAGCPFFNTKALEIGQFD